MRMRLGGVALTAACLLWLAGCDTTSTPDNPFRKITDAIGSAPGGAGDDATGTIVAPPGSPPPSPFGRLPESPALTPDILGNDPNDDLNLGKRYFRQGSYGLAERHFRKAVELQPRDAESWVGLAAAYDRLRRFDLADRAYEQAIKLIGQTPAVMNNQGFSYMLRSDYRRARSILLAAKAKEPANPHIAANLRMLDEAERKSKGAQVGSIKVRPSGESQRAVQLRRRAARITMLR